MAEIIDCTYQDSYGSALRVVDSRVVLRDNNFLNNCAQMESVNIRDRGVLEAVFCFFSAKK